MGGGVWDVVFAINFLEINVGNLKHFLGFKQIKHKPQNTNPVMDIVSIVAISFKS